MSGRVRLIEEIFCAAADLPPGPRTALITARCGGDPALEAEVRSLLDHHSAAGERFLDPQEIKEITLGPGRGRLDDAALAEGSRAGEYVIRGVLGQGGMGLVYVAEQSRPRRTVALKLIRRGLGTAGLVRRFEHEAEVLGRLQHAGIAQIYAAGVADVEGPDGRAIATDQPYIAMELVRGRTLTRHAASENLDTRQRLALLAKVCHAVEHAHQRGIIHRDLKPANILVDDASQPKVLDFGVARVVGGEAMASTTVHTGVGQLIGTLPYMSPEQVAGDPASIDLRTDVYALGVVLYELLTGKLPHDVSGRPMLEAARIIREDEPSRLSSIDRGLRGDIETIVAKAIAKDRVRRYASVAELREDLERYLDGLPIRARQDSALYLVRKQLRRYRSAAIAAVVALVAVAILAWQALASAREFSALASREREARVLASDAQRDAEAQRDRADATAQRLQHELIAANIERGRLEGVAGNIALAEDFLWREHFRDPDSPSARWAIWELLHRNPCLWTVSLDADPAAATLHLRSSRLAIALPELGALSIHSTDDGRRLTLIDQLPARPLAVAFDAAGERLAWVGDDGRTYLTHLAEARTRPLPLDREPTPGRAGAIAWSRQGEFLASGAEDGVIHLWHGADLVHVRALDAHAAGITALTFAPGSTMLASGSRELGPDARVRVWDAASGTLHRELDGHAQGISALEFGDDAGTLLTGSRDRRAFLHHLTDGSREPLTNTSGGAITSFSRAAGRPRAMIAVGSTLIASNIPTDMAPVLYRGHRAEVVSVFLVGPNRVLSIARDRTIRGWDLRRVPAMTGIGVMGWGFGVAYSPDGRLLAASFGSGSLVIVDAQTRRRLHTFLIGTGIRARGVAFTRDSKTLIVGSSDGQVRLIDTDLGLITGVMRDAPSEIFAVAIDPRAPRFATGHADGSIRLWSIDQRAHLTTLPRLERRVEGVAFSPDGELLASSGLTRGVQLWDARTLEPLERLDGTTRVWPVAFSPDGATLIAGGGSGEVDVYDVATRVRRATLPAHQRLIAAIGFSPDGRFLATGSDDTTVRVWDTNTLKPLVSFETFHGEASALAFSPDSTRIACGAQNNFAPIYDLRAMDAAIDANREYHRKRLGLDLPASGGRPAAEP